MNETRRFLRYVIPGLVFLLEAGLLLCLSDKSWIWLNSHEKLITNEKLIGSAITIFVASGGIGYILAIKSGWPSFGSRGAR